MEGGGRERESEWREVGFGGSDGGVDCVGVLFEVLSFFFFFFFFSHFLVLLKLIVCVFFLKALFK